MEKERWGKYITLNEEFLETVERHFNYLKNIAVNEDGVDKEYWIKEVEFLEELEAKIKDMKKIGEG